MSDLPIIVVGAGIAGLTAAYDLQRSGRQVVVLESATTPGGRMTSRVLHGCVIDCGAQFLSTEYRVIADLLHTTGLGNRLRKLSDNGALVRNGVAHRVHGRDFTSPWRHGLVDFREWMTLLRAFLRIFPLTYGRDPGSITYWAEHDDDTCAHWFSGGDTTKGTHPMLFG